ncbi:MAG: tRNA glutamyl-Q(34) synthetase GluQRS [Sphingomicrobium sp.]
MNIARFAPSPTGPLHLGHAWSAVLGHSLADKGGFLLRIEDLDQARSRLEYVAAIGEDLAWLGIEPARAPLLQSQRTAHYQSALEQLRAQGLAYACFCTRADIAAALAAPHGASAHYPSTCRALPDDPARRSAEPHCWRLDSAAALARTGIPTWHEGGALYTAARAELDDIILARKDAPASYHLACVIDDAASGVTLVVRGADLRPSTPVQRLLQMLLGLPAPAYHHHRLVTHADGRRLAKRDRAPTLAALRAAGFDGRTLAADLLAADLQPDRLPLGFGWAEA